MLGECDSGGKCHGSIKGGKGFRMNQVKNERLYPPITSHSYLVLVRRRELLQREVARLVADGLRGLTLLDVGGHDRPYKGLFLPLVSNYIAMDLCGREADVHARGELIPFRDRSMDIVLCTQVLEHVIRPEEIVDEIHRVLKPGGVAFISVPAVFPLHGGPYDNWRFMAGGLKILLRGFSDVQVSGEGGTVAGFFRTLNMYLFTFCGRPWASRIKWIIPRSVFPMTNLLGRYLDPLVRSGDTFAVSWLAVAVK